MRTDEKLQAICDELTRNCGDIHAAARANGCSPAFVVSWMKDDPEAAKAIDEACRVGWLGLESEAIRRGVEGVEKGVYYKGQRIDTERVYSDGLLSKVMEARLPAYKKGEGGNTFHGPTQINIMPRAENYEQWLEMKAQTLAKREELPLLEGEFTEVAEGMECLKGLL